jgi:hypothetical protein
MLGASNVVSVCVTKREVLLVYKFSEMFCLDVSGWYVNDVAGRQTHGINKVSLCISCHRET